MGLRTVVRGLLLGCGLVRAPAPTPLGRPFETIAADVRRLGARFHTLPLGTSYCKVGAVSHAYDRALSECADALGLSHLLSVLEPGTDRDLERQRLERALHCWGLVMHDPA